MNVIMNPKWTMWFKPTNPSNTTGARWKGSFTLAFFRLSIQTSHGQLKHTFILMFPCHFCRSLNITCLGFSTAAIYSFLWFCVFLTACPHAGLNVNKPTSRCHSNIDTQICMQSLTVFLFLDGFFGSLLCCLWSLCASKIKALDTCTSPQRFVSSLHNMVCAWVCVLLSVCKERKTQR